MNQEPQPSTVASKDSPSLCLADQDPSTSPSVSPQGVVKWKDLDQEVKDWVVSLMPQSIKQQDGKLYAKSRRCTSNSYVTYYKCRDCSASSVGTLQMGASAAIIKKVRPHSCSIESKPSQQQPLVIIDYTEEMKTAAAERAYSQLSKSPRTLAIEIYEEFDRRANLEGAFVYTYIYPCVYAIYIYICTYSMTSHIYSITPFSIAFFAR